ncbi:MAG: hypothetical protein ACRC20_05535 [Segniliparus sp.]|uniref:hypothetical protein n=1 Tax=Segniliparus sp. TaxID=2804064 RepID=UPI003F36E3DE
MKSDWYAYSDRRRWGYFDDEEKIKRTSERPKPAPVTKPQRASDSTGLSRADAARTATAMVADLVAQSRSCPGIDWAVSGYEDGGVTRFYAVSNEGAGFLPPGLRWDLRLRHVFGPAVPDGELGPWLGLDNPARTLADHCLALRASSPELKLVCLVGSRPVGEAVAQLQGMLCATGPVAGAVAVDAAARAATRIAAVDGGETEAVIAGIPVQERWAAGLDLALDAARLCAFHRQSPQLASVLEALRAGRTDARGVALAWQEGARLSAQARSRRVPDSRLGLLDLYSAAPTMAQAMTLSAGFDYAWPFYAARACAIVAILLRSRLDDVPLGKNDLAELAYEHVCVGEDLPATRAMLAAHSAKASRAR